MTNILPFLALGLLVAGAVAARWPHPFDGLVARMWRLPMTDHHNDEAAQLLRQTDGER
jgi:hypothetical protein